MGSKVNPLAFRLGKGAEFKAKWFADKPKQFVANLKETFILRKCIADFFGEKQSIISNIVVEKTGRRTCVSIFTGQPSALVSWEKKSKEHSRDAVDRSKEETVASSDENNNVTPTAEKEETKIDVLRQLLAKMCGKTIDVVIKQEFRWDSNPVILCMNIAKKIENRENYKRVIKGVLRSSVRNPDIKGIKITACGRLRGSRSPKTEKVSFKLGKMPLQTTKANIEQHVGVARTTSGICGIRVAIYRGDLC